MAGVRQKSWKDLKISVLLTGSELIDGRLQDSNSYFLSRFLFERGQRLARVLVCDDLETDIADSLAVLAERSDIIITSGGLGPTTGDKTREAISQFLGVPLKLDEDSLLKIKVFFERRGRPYEKNNDKQAFIPEGATVIPNEYGTATCFSAQFQKGGNDSGILFALPGVPRELETLVAEQVLPAILSACGSKKSDLGLPNLHTIRIFGLGESAISARIVESAPSSEIEISYRATFPEVQVLFRAGHNVSEKDLSSSVQNAIEKLGSDYVFSNNSNLALPEVIHKLMLERQQTLCIAESCTGGLVGAGLTQLPKSSQYFLGSIVAYDNALKRDLLRVDESLLQQKGAVSIEVAQAMAEGARKVSGATFGLAVTGIAGPDGGTPDKPVGTCYLALSSGAGNVSAKISLSGSRDRVRQYAVAAVLDLLRRQVLQLPIRAPVFSEVSAA